jgi:hypothetical protein
MDDIFYRIRQRALDNAQNERIRTAERQIADTGDDSINAATRLTYVLAFLIDRLAEKEGITVEEADSLRAMLPQFTDSPSLTPAEALADMSGSRQSSEETEAAALAAMSGSADPQPPENQE